MVHEHCWRPSGNACCQRPLLKNEFCDRWHQYPTLVVCFLSSVAITLVCYNGRHLTKANNARVPPALVLNHFLNHFNSFVITKKNFWIKSVTLFLNLLKNVYQSLHLLLSTHQYTITAVFSCHDWNPLDTVTPLHSDRLPYVL